MKAMQTEKLGWIFFRSLRLMKRKLLEFAIEYAKKELKANRATLGVFANNPKAQACYEAVGFKPYNKRVMNILGADWECIDMEMELEKKKLDAL